MEVVHTSDDNQSEFSLDEFIDLDGHIDVYVTLVSHAYVHVMDFVANTYGR